MDFSVQLQQFDITRFIGDSYGSMTSHRQYVHLIMYPSRSIVDESVFYLFWRILRNADEKDQNHVQKKLRAHTWHIRNTLTYTHRLSVISEWLPSGLHPILGIAYFSNVYRNIGIILPSESDRMTEKKRNRERVIERMCIHDG